MGKAMKQRFRWDAASGRDKDFSGEAGSLSAAITSAQAAVGKGAAGAMIEIEEEGSLVYKARMNSKLVWCVLPIWTDGDQ